MRPRRPPSSSATFSRASTWSDAAAGKDRTLAFAKFLVLFGLLIAAAGLLLWWGVPIGRLPGDLVIRRGSFSFHLPITTSILVSILLTVLMAVFKR